MKPSEKEIVLKMLQEEYDHAKAKEQEWDQKHGDPIRLGMVSHYRGKAEGLYCAICLLKS